MDIDTSAATRRYIDESQRLSLCRDLVVYFVPPELAIDHDLPVSNWNGPGGFVKLDVGKLKLAHDVSAN